MGTSNLEVYMRHHVGRLSKADCMTFSTLYHLYSWVNNNVKSLVFVFILYTELIWIESYTLAIYPFLTLATVYDTVGL